MRGSPVYALLLSALATAAAPPARTQDVRVLSDAFARNFERSEDPETRLGVVRDAVASKVSGMGEFYHKVALYVANRGADLASDDRLGEMARLACAKIAEERVRDARAALWELYKAAGDTGVRVAALKALEVTAVGDRALAVAMAAALEGQNRLFGTRDRPDLQVVLALVKALAAGRDPAAFSALFGARVAGYSAEITAAADSGLLAIEGDLQELLGSVVRTGLPAERRDAFALALASARIDAKGRAGLAEEALRVALAAGAASPEHREIYRELRASAASVLESTRWSRATPLMVEHFSTAVLEYDRGQVTAGYLVAAAAGLGAMGTHEAAERLTLYLELLNSYRDHGQPRDEQIVLAVIGSLKRLGDKVAFSNLSFVQNLGYSDRVKQAARDAIAALKW